MADTRAARVLGCTDGQVWTLGLTIVVAAVLLPATLPAGLRPHGDVVIRIASAPAAAGPLAPAPGPVALPPVPGVLPPIPLPQPGLQPQPQPQAQPEPAPSGPTPVPTSDRTPPASEQPLQVVQAGWYDADSEAAVRQQLTPPGDLPVSADRGARAATSVLRLSGNAPNLLLMPNGTPVVGTPVLELCRNATADWTGFDAMPVSQAPAVTKECVRGTVDGARWSFALDELGAPDAATGFTLRAVVSGAPTETFAITFTRETPS